MLKSGNVAPYLIAAKSGKGKTDIGVPAVD
jgi:hypothetical protein